MKLTAKAQVSSSPYHYFCRKSLGYSTSSGFSLLELIIILSLMSLMALALGGVFIDSSKQLNKLQRMYDALDLKNFLNQAFVTSSSNSVNCLVNFYQPGTGSPVTIDSSTGSDFVMNELFLAAPPVGSTTLPTEIQIKVGSFNRVPFLKTPASPSSSVGQLVNRISISTQGSWMLAPKLEIELAMTPGSAIPPKIFIPLNLQFNASDPAAVRITSCQMIASGGEPAWDAIQSNKPCLADLYKCPVQAPSNFVYRGCVGQLSFDSTCWTFVSSVVGSGSGALTSCPKVGRVLLSN